MEIKGRIALVVETLFLLEYFQKVWQIRPVIVLRGRSSKEGVWFVILTVIQPFGDQMALGKRERAWGFEFRQHLKGSLLVEGIEGKSHYAQGGDGKRIVIVIFDERPISLGAGGQNIH